ncbi:oligosaccharide flippase family protein [Shimia litoralis]|uniref:oligosaccharide flippase family protein n=1 Tax=Shimia litoralis TaxID=420403 RepID=UPI0014856ECD|nr:oligosaccharide flippase family protein [Shimia litoralis]
MINKPRKREQQSSASAIAMTYARQFLTGAAQLGLILISARTLGATQTGHLALALVFPKVLAAFLNLGMGSANVYFIASRQVAPQTAWAYARNLTTIMSLLGLCLGAVVISIASELFFAGIDESALAISLIALPCILLVSATASILQGMQDFPAFNRAVLFQPVLAFFGVVILWLFDTVNLKLLIILVSLSHGIAGISALVALSLRIPLVSGGVPTGQYARKAFGYGVKSHLSNLLTYLNYRTDIFLVNAIAGPSAAGLYAIAIRLAEQVWLISQAFATIALPRFSTLTITDNARNKVAPQMARIALWLTISAAGLLAVCAEPLIALLFGAEFVASSATFRILLIGVVALSASQILASDLASRGLVGMNLTIMALVLFVNIAGNLKLIPEYGIEGAAMATSGAFAAGLAARLFLTSMLFNTKLWSPLARSGSEIRNIYRDIRGHRHHNNR